MTDMVEVVKLRKGGFATQGRSFSRVSAAVKHVKKFNGSSVRIEFRPANDKENTYWERTLK